MYITKSERGTKVMCITCKAHVCQNFTISWFLGLAFSSAFVAFSNSTSLHVQQKKHLLQGKKWKTQVH